MTEEEASKSMEVEQTRAVGSNSRLTTRAVALSTFKQLQIRPFQNHARSPPAALLRKNCFYHKLHFSNIHA